MISRAFRKCFTFFGQPMMRPIRTLLLLFLGCAGAMAVLLFAMPSFKQAAKAWAHRTFSPDPPAERSTRHIATDGTISYADPFPYCGSDPGGQPTLFYDFECPESTWFTSTKGAYSGKGVMNKPGLSAAIVRRVGDVSDQLVAISVGFMMKCPASAPDLRVVIRIDHADGSLLEWNEKRLLANEHHPDQWERFNFEWILRDLSTGEDDLVSLFVVGEDEALWIDDLSIVFRSRTPVSPVMPHA